MSDSDTHQVDRATVRRTVQQVVLTTADPSRSDLIESLTALTGCTTATAEEEVAALHDAGLLYYRGDGADPEVRLP